MIQTPYAAFGYIVLKNDVEAGDVLNDELFKSGVYSVYSPSPFSDGRFGEINSGYVWLYLSGNVKHTNLFTNEVKYRTRGHCNIDTPEDVGFFKVEFLESSKVFCLGPAVNAGKTPPVPTVGLFKLLAGESTTLAGGTKLFLAEGDLNVNGNVLSGERQIQVGSASRAATAVSDCYGFIFP